MKFGKEFASQTVPEWREAYMNYEYLKTLLEEILVFRRRLTRPPENPSRVAQRPSFKRKVSLFRAFSGLTNSTSKRHKEDEVIIVSEVKQRGDEEHGGVCQTNYQTVFLLSSEEGGDLESQFFRRLDNEFNKVNNFYKSKVEEAVKQAEELSIQMEALVALRVKVNNPSMEVMVQESKSNEEHQDQNMVSLDVLNRVKINATTETPRSTVRGVFNSLNVDLNYNKNEVKNAQGKLKQAFLEFNEMLKLLKNYAFMNQMAFSKIMKKYDKITSRNASDTYMEMVDESYLSQSDEIYTGIRVWLGCSHEKSYRRMPLDSCSVTTRAELSGVTHGGMKTRVGMDRIDNLTRPSSNHSLSISTKSDKYIKKNSSPSYH